jgi:hypothetical protein
MRHAIEEALVIIVALPFVWLFATFLIWSELDDLRRPHFVDSWELKNGYN